jgi:hypothetical protein
MRLRFPLILLLVAMLFDCGCNSKESAAVTKYKTAVAALLEEARVMARILQESPTHAAVVKQRDRVNDAFLRLPEMPTELDPSGKFGLNEQLRTLNRECDLAASELGFGEQAAKFGVGAKDSGGEQAETAKLIDSTLKSLKSRLKLE